MLVKPWCRVEGGWKKGGLRKSTTEIGGTPRRSPGNAAVSQTLERQYDNECGERTDESQSRTNVDRVENTGGVGVWKGRVTVRCRTDRN